MITKKANFGDKNGKLYRGKYIFDTLNGLIDNYTESLVFGDHSWEQVNVLKGRIFALMELASIVESDKDEGFDE